MWEDKEDEEHMSFDEIRKLPIHQKAMDLVQMVLALKAHLDPDDEMRQETLNHMVSDAMQIPAKIAGAIGGGLYDLKMENAAIIRKAAREILVATNHFRNKKDGSFEDYVQVLRDEIEAFRLLFVDWVEAFDPWDYIIDRWGLFNPPGVSAHDKDPDDDIPFNPEDDIA